MCYGIWETLHFTGLKAIMCYGIWETLHRVQSDNDVGRTGLMSIKNLTPR